MVISGYYFFNENIRESSRELGFYYNTIKDYWALAGLKANIRSQRRYSDYGGSVGCFNRYYKNTGISQFGLFQMTPALYKKLSRDGKLEEVIPEKKSRRKEKRLN